MPSPNEGSRINTVSACMRDHHASTFTTSRAPMARRSKVPGKTSKQASAGRETHVVLSKRKCYLGGSVQEGMFVVKPTKLSQSCRQNKAAPATTLDLKVDVLHPKVRSSYVGAKLPFGRFMVHLRRWEDSRIWYMAPISWFICP